MYTFGNTAINQNTNNSNLNASAPSSPDRLLVGIKNLILVGLTLVVIGELIWAGWYLTKSKPASENTPNTNQTSQTNDKDKNILSVQTANVELKVNDEFTVEIMVQSSLPTDGMDVILSYDPNILEVVLKNADTNPVVVDSIYSDYPVNKLDKDLGRISLSGISSKDGGVVANGKVGSIVFKTKSAGKTQINFDFKNDSTVDSNLVETKTGKDILTEVKGLQLNIQQ